LKVIMMMKAKVKMYNCTTCGLINQVTNLSKVLPYS